MDAYFTAAALLVVALVYGLDRFGYLPKRRTSSEAAAELDINARTIDRLSVDLNHAREQLLALEKTRSLEPVLTQLRQNAELQAQVLDRLVHHNGSFAHMERSLREISEGFKLMTGYIAGAVGVRIDDSPPS